VVCRWIADWRAVRYGRLLVHENKGADVTDRSRLFLFRLLAIGLVLALWLACLGLTAGTEFLR